jgi:hypothetical protein
VNWFTEPEGKFWPDDRGAFELVLFGAFAAERSQACSRETLTNSRRKIGSRTVAIPV